MREEIRTKFRILPYSIEQNGIRFSFQQELPWQNEFDGNKYLKASKHQKEWEKKLIEELNIQKSDYILDLGCGDGLLTKMIKDIASDGYVLGIDASEGMISKAEEYKLPNLEFKQLDINDIVFENMFSIIISNATLHWVKDHEKLLANCYKALKPNGILRFNFAEFKIWEENADRHFLDEEEMIRWIDQPSIVPLLKCINQEKIKKEFRNEVVSAMIELTKEKDGRYFETFRRINVYAKKMLSFLAL